MGRSLLDEWLSCEYGRKVWKRDSDPGVRKGAREEIRSDIPRAAEIVRGVILILDTPMLASG